MLTKQMKFAMILTAAMSTSALAQTAVEVETPDGQTVIAPGAAVESDGVSPIATVVESDFPVFNQDMNDAAIAETLIAQGFGDVYILRDGSLMTVTATRDGDDIKLVYNLVEGRLIEVNGERVLTEEERTLDQSGENQTATPATEETAPEEGEATEDGGMDDDTDGATDGATDGSTGGATDGSTDDATDGATDGATDDATDGATDGATDTPDSDTGSDTGADSDTDTGSDSDTDSDSGSDGGSDGTGGSDSDSTNG